MEEQEPVAKRFIVDDMLGKLAKWLRVLGFDARYERLVDQGQLDRYRREGFLAVTRNHRWCNQPMVLCPSSNDPMEQLGEIIALASIGPGEVRLLQRCILCNQPLAPLVREQAFGRVPDYVFETSSSFYQCSTCHRIFWPGSHPKRMSERLHRLFGWTVSG